MGLLPATFGCVAMGFVTGVVSTSIMHVVLLATHQHDSLQAFCELAITATVLQTPLLMAGCLCWLLPASGGLYDKLANAWPVAGRRDLGCHSGDVTSSIHAAPNLLPGLAT